MSSEVRPGLEQIIAARVLSDDIAAGRITAEKAAMMMSGPRDAVAGGFEKTAADETNAMADDQGNLAKQAAAVVEK